MHISGVRVTYESAQGQRVEADAVDLGGGGVFVRTATPLLVGKRISLEIQVMGEAGPWSAMGRVVWSREKGAGDKAPPGMGIKLIDADDGVVAALDRLVGTREHTVPGAGLPSAPPKREPSVAMDLAAPGRPTSAAPPAAPPLDRPSSSTGRVIVIVFLFIVAAAAAYVLLDGFLRPPPPR